MAMIQSGADSSLLTVDPTFKAARITVRPPEGVGFYQLGASTGNLTNTTVVGSNAPLFGMRWAPANGKIAIIRKIGIGFVQTVAWTAAAAQQFNLFVARSWTVSDTGGTQITISGNTNKNRTTHDPSLFALPSDVRVAGTATYTAGTRTLDTNPLATTVFATSQVAAGSATYPQQYNIIHDVNTGDHPIVLDNNEGIVLTNVTTWPASANAQMYFNIEWYETSAY